MISRFSSVEECETVCVVLDELGLTGNHTAFSRKAICAQPPVEGPCVKEMKRWYYEPERGTCVPFIYRGCGGNRLTKFK